MNVSVPAALGAAAFVPIPRGDKVPAGKWRNVRLSSIAAQAHLDRGGNLALRVGQDSGGVVDIDLDCREAIQLTASQNRVLELLAVAISTAGEVPPTNNHIPAGVPCVSEAAWREYCYAGQITGSDKPGARQKAFKRAADDLLAAGRVGKWGNLVWLVQQ